MGDVIPSRDVDALQHIPVQNQDNLQVMDAVSYQDTEHDDIPNNVDATHKYG